MTENISRFENFELLYCRDGCWLGSLTCHLYEVKPNVIFASFTPQIKITLCVNETQQRWVELPSLSPFSLNAHQTISIITDKAFFHFEEKEKRGFKDALFHEDAYIRTGSPNPSAS